ncbi:MAG TPA: VIT domain-containing protein [Thermoguttaceae bacterium]|nr:VIT domain-containing protein [Thermoguttaceae bacterium]
MNPNDNPSEDDRYAALLASIDTDTVAPDKAFLDRLRERSTEVFAAEHRRSALQGRRRRRMMVAALRTLAGAAAAAVLAAAWLWSSTSPSDSAVAFGEVLQNVIEADTLHLEITRDGKTGQVWAKRPQQLRWDEGGGRYKIAKGEKLWVVDEGANRATSQASPYFHADQPGTNVLDLLELPGEPDRESLLRARPVDQVRREGRDCELYRIEWPTAQGRIRIEALADRGTRLLRSLEATAVTRDVGRPIGRLTVLAVNEPVDEDLFVVGDTLTEDGRIGKVTDAQGIVSLRPVMHERWTPVDRSLVLKPGDWLRTDVRGANGVRVRLAGETELTLGPGSLVELARPNRIRVFDGELKIVAGGKSPIKLLGPSEQEIAVRGTGTYRLRDQRLVPVDEAPLWLRGFEGATANESIGSLVANVEGRNVPLSVGYHKVTVDVRDQIARTVIEESFVNHTAGRLEGVFYFPLPDDASISGFGMWIGDELVEADVVEKQRAREIYETILREKRDPGLLEWSGGNLFKARVFPIEPHSEKRVKLSYTQVLPLRGGRFRYSYPLRSEMLEQHPLRELAIDVTVNSVAPLASVASPTHDVRVRKTRRSARLEFAAQEYTPTRDFEVVVEVERGGSDTVLIPHRRGDDGYFMLLVTPPAVEGDFERDVLPDGEPIELLILADTSASIDAEGRESQAEFLAAVLSSLGSKDTFNLATCDVTCDWVFPKPMAAEPENVAKARQSLADRTSLGWTDLDGAFASAWKQTGRRTHVVYVGDGAVTTADADPAAFSKRLRRLGEGKPGTFHAVSVGSTFEPVVLRTIASLGGGSMRRITGERGPQAVARELLAEIAKPALRDLNVEFRGIRTARVYPERLPNLPAGSQQILLGRYLPEGQDQTGEVVVTGTQGDRPIRFTTPVSLKDAEQGNSFIPRLWARMHLDSLLQQGASQAIRDEIVALSEEYHVITPYTSLLVLESDEDRERFKVERRFQMRDGERFFAEGRSDADYELLRQQMRLAGQWRAGLRRAVLAQLAALGRDVQTFDRTRYEHVQRTERVAGPTDYLAFAYSYEGASSIGPRGGFVAGKGGSGPGFDVNGRFGGDAYGLRLNINARGAFDVSDIEDLLVTESSALYDRRMIADTLTPVGSGDLDVSFGDDLFFMSGGGSPLDSAESAPATASLPSRSRRLSPQNQPLYSQMAWLGEPPVPRYTQWLGTLFPGLPKPPEEKPWKPKRPWPREARDLAQTLLRNDELARIEGGLQIDRRTQSFEVRSGDLSSRSRTLSLVSPKRWLIRSEADRSQTTVQWCNDRERGILSEAFQLGRLRASTPADLRTPPLSLSGNVLTPLDRTYEAYSAELKPQGENRVLLVLTHPSRPKHQVHVLVDTERHVVLRIETREDDQVGSSTVFGDFVEAAGAWWAGRIETFDKKGRRTTLVAQEFKPIAADVFVRRVQKELAGREHVQFLREPLTKVVDAKRALAAGKAGFDDHTALVLHFSRSQQWDRVMEHLDAAEQAAADKPAVRWVRNAILDVSRRREELKQRIVDEAARLANGEAANKAESEGLFLADRLVSQAASFLPPIEMLPLVESLEPVYQRAEPHLRALRQWSQRRADLLRQLERPEEELRIRKELAEGYPYDADVQAQYARALVNKGEYQAAKAWLDRVLGRDFEWYEHEEQSLRGVWADSLRSRGRYPELVDYLAAWVERNPESATAYQQYLSALILADREGEANTLMTTWLAEARTPDKLAPAVAARLDAAVLQALGQGYNLWTDWIDQRWLEPLAEAALFFARHESGINTAARIMGDYRFQRSDPCRRVRRTIADVLRAEIDTLAPVQINQFVEWILPNDPELDPQAWKQIAAGLHRRWSAEKKPEVKHQLAQPLARVLSSHATTDEHLAFLRLQWREGDEQYRAGYALQLFSALIGQPWSAEREDEAFGLLDELSGADEPTERLAAEVGALHRLTDAMVRARFDAGMKKVKHQERLTRTELEDKKVESLRLARGGFADRLRREIPNRAKPPADWMNVERLYLETIVGRDLDAVAEECWELLGAEPPGPREGDPEREQERRLQEVLENRFLVTLVNLAARRNAKPALVDRVLAYLDRGIAVDPESARWKGLKYQLLVALDRPAELEKALRSWTGVDDPDNHWRRSLAYLLAEQGQIPEAITLFEAIQAADELRPDDYRALAGWYMVAGRRPAHDRALVEVYKATDQWQLRNWIEGKLRPWQQSDGQLPSQFDPEVLRAFAALFEKSGRPEDHLGQLQQFYQATCDFRLLACLADAVVGHSAAKVYPFLKGMGPVLSEIRDEATADSLAEQVAEVRKRATTPVDQRALDLLEALVERRAAEVLNQPGPHVDKALAAFQRAFQREWAEGEPRLVADLLGGLGRISQPKLADEQIRQLEVLHRREAEGSLDRLHVAHHLAQALWSYARRDEAVDLMESALTEFEDASGGVLPVEAREPLSTFISYLEKQGHHARGEKVLLAQLERPINRQQQLWLTERLYQLYVHAVGNDGHVSLGTGPELYRAVGRRLHEALDTDDHNHRHNLVARLCDLYRTAKDKQWTGVADDLKAFAAKRLPDVLKRQTDHYDSCVRTVADTMHTLAGVREGLTFLVERIENEPAWLRYRNRDGWSQHAWELARWRHEAKELDRDLEARLLKIVLAELRRDLVYRNSRNRTIYQHENQYFWAEKADAFARTAEEVLAEQKQSGATVQYVAEYLYHGLGRYARAIEILFSAHGQGILDERGQSTLVEFLHQRERYGESIAVLEPLVERRPDNVQYRVWLMHAYFRTDRGEELLTQLKKTDSYFHRENRWQEDALAALAHSCLENKLYKQSVAYYEELIPLVQRTDPRRGIGNESLSRYYGYLAQAYAGLGKTAEAVDAAGGAIVCWGPRHDRRKEAIDALKHVIRQAPDLDAYAAQLNQQSDQTGQDKPIVRKAIGQIYLEKGEPDKAIAQLRLACGLQPNDAETHQALIECYDRKDDKPGAVRQILQSLQLARRDVERYRDLGRRLDALEQPGEAERAYTSIVEVLPNETESHALLAEVRREQDRWPDAILHWQRVAQIRALEPTGLVKLAAAQVHERRWDEAARTVEKLKARSWPPRFGNVEQEIRDLEQQIERGRGK